MITFKVKSELYGQTDCVITNITHTLKTGFAPCGDGCDYKLSPFELEQLKRIQKDKTIPFMRLPEKKHILNILKLHPLVQLKHKPKKVFLVGSFAANKQHKKSDIDIMMIVPGNKNLTDQYRKKIADYFVKNKISVADHLHPNYEGRRIDLYFSNTTDGDTLPKIELK